ncbi:MAG: hypothetical protein ACW97X_07635 [Candidatus Hodarchaeales archaeon]|jgi:hypothetical protein
MPLFAQPEVSEFFDNRLIISWLIAQPQQYSELSDLVIQISTDHSVIFEPLQEKKVTIPPLSDNDIIINWVIQKPIHQTEIFLKIQNQDIDEEYTININPDDF